MRISKTEANAWQALDDQYVHATGNVEHDLVSVILWADECGIPTPGSDLPDPRLERLSSALQADTSRDRYGREVRNRLCKTVTVEGEDGRLVQQNLWAHYDHASDEFLAASAWQRHRNISNDVERLKADVDRMNEGRIARDVPPVQMSFNFDLEEQPPEAA